MPSQNSSTENTVICSELVFSLHSLALHEFPNDIFTNEDRRQGAVVLHVLCVSTPERALAGGSGGKAGGGWAVSCIPDAGPLTAMEDSL